MGLQVTLKVTRQQAAVRRRKSILNGDWRAWGHVEPWVPAVSHQRQQQKGLRLQLQGSTSVLLTQELQSWDEASTTAAM